MITTLTSNTGHVHYHLEYVSKLNGKIINLCTLQNIFHPTTRGIPMSITPSCYLTYPLSPIRLKYPEFKTHFLPSEKINNLRGIDNREFPASSTYIYHDSLICFHLIKNVGDCKADNRVGYALKKTVSQLQLTIIHERNQPVFPFIL